MPHAADLWTETSEPPRPPSSRIDYREIVGLRKETRLATERVAELEARVVAAEARTAELVARAVAAEARAWRVEAELALARIPEVQREIARRWLLAEKPADVDAFVASFLKGLTP